MAGYEKELKSLSIDLAKAGWGMQLVETATNLFAICSNDEILYINAAGLKLLGSETVVDVVGKKFTDFIHEDYKEFIEFGLEVFAEEDDFVPLKFLTLKGEALDVKLMVNPLHQYDQIGYIVEVQNITEYKRASEAVRDREHRIKSILNTVTEGILTFNTDGLIETFNPAAEKIFGYSTQEILGQHVEVLMPHENRRAYNRFFRKNIIKGNSRLVGKLWELTGLHKIEGPFPMEMTVTKLQVGSDHIFTAVFRDITERKQSEERIRHLAHHDQLTGLPNRHLFTDRLYHATKISKRYNKSLVLMFIDLDKFKPINDTLGHEAGDIVLKEVARRFLEIVRESDTVARIGGDEFVILLEELDHADPGHVVAEKLLDSLSKPILVGGRECVIGLSIGLSKFPEDSDNPDELMRCADEAMYMVKSSGRNSYLFYDKTNSGLEKDK
jgi:diguanylate cyclase (GGDEF)-like protein/PAS domain S-box-containing protein